MFFAFSFLPFQLIHYLVNVKLYMYFLWVYVHFMSYGFEIWPALQDTIY